MYFSDFILVTKWWLVLLLIGVSFLPITNRLFNKFIDKGYIFSKIIGISLITYAFFVLSSLHVLSFSTLSLVAVWLLFLALNLFILRKDKTNYLKDLKIFILEEFLFFLCLLAWALVRSYNPAIHDLEKFMDFGFINSILRSTYMPPRDIWLTPYTINYYYFGHLATAVLTKLTNIPSLFSFNLMIATIFAFCFTMSFSIGINLVNSFKELSLKTLILIGIISAYITTFAGNLQTIYSLFRTYSGGEYAPAFWNLVFSPQTFPNSYWYPNATRFIFHTIHEFPLYSFVVADLHGHVLDIPIVFTLIGLSLVLFLGKTASRTLLLFISFFLSVAYMTNAWDGPIYLGLFSIIFFVKELFNDKNRDLLKRVFYSFARSLKYVMPLFIFFLIFSFIFNQSFSPFASGIGLNCSPDFLVKVGNIGPFLFEKGQCQHSPFWQLLILYGFFIYMFVAFSLFIRKKEKLISDYFILAISLFSFFLLLVPEIFYLKDIYSGHFRANTMFKLSYQAFIMLSLSSVYILVRILFSVKKDAKKIRSKIQYLAFIIGAIFLISFVSIYPYFAIPSGYGGLTKYQGLNGINYLKENKASDLQAIQWINKNIKGQPVILEAQGDSYTDFSRISSNTGLPTLLGWTVHEWLWRGSYDIPAGRFSDIQNLYETPDLNVARKIIKKYKISLIYIGSMEREKYKVNETKFLKLGKVIYENSGAKIYKLN